MAAEPTLLAVDDDPAVFAAIARELRTRYGGAFRIVRVHADEIRVRSRPATTRFTVVLPGGVSVLPDAGRVARSPRRFAAPGVRRSRHGAAGRPRAARRRS